MWREIGDAFSLLGTQGDDCRCIILTGSGKSFCSGIDLTDPKFNLLEMNDKDDAEGEDNDNCNDIARKYLSFRPKVLEMQQCFSAVEECTVPVLVAIHGSCIGGGIDLASSADIRICSPNTKFSIREVRLGLAADVGTLQRLPKIVGHSSRVRELCYTGEDFDAYESERIGFVSRISKSEDQLLPLAIGISELISRNSPIAVSGTKISLNYSRDHSVKEGLHHIATHNAAALMTQDLGGTEFLNLLPHARL